MNSQIFGSSKSYKFIEYLLNEGIPMFGIFGIFIPVFYASRSGELLAVTIAIVIGICVEALITLFLNSNLWLLRIVPLMSYAVGFLLISQADQSELSTLTLVYCFYIFAHAAIMIIPIEQTSFSQRLFVFLGFLILKILSIMVLIGSINPTESSRDFGTIELYLVPNMFFLVLLIVFNNVLLLWRNAELESVGHKLKNISNWHVDDKVIVQNIKTPDSDPISHQTKSVMFGDIRGFSRFSEQSELEDILKVLNTFYKLSEEVIERYNGAKPEFIADEVITHFSEAKDAVNCALELNPMLNNYLSQYSLSFGIGVNCGDVIEGVIGGESSKKFTIFGDTVNVASRLQSNAEGNQILINENILNVLPGLEVTEVFGITLKNISKPMRYFSVLGWVPEKQAEKRSFIGKIKHIIGPIHQEVESKQRV